MTGIRVLVFGGRKFDDRALVFKALDAIDRRDGPIAAVIHGAAPGADTLAGEWAKERGREPLPFPAEWEDVSHPKAAIKHHADGRPYNALAGKWRNQQMLDEGRPDLGVAFEGRAGTADMYCRLQRAGIRRAIVKKTGVKYAND